MQHLRVDTVDRHVLEDVLRVALGCTPARLAVARDRPALVPRGVQAAKHTSAALDERLDLEVLLPHGAIAQMPRKPLAEEVGGFEEVPVTETTKSFCVMCVLPAETCFSQPAKVVDRSVQCNG